MKNTWILIAHGTSGMILGVHNNKQAPSLVKEFAHPRTAKKDLAEGTSSKKPSAESLQHAIDYDKESKDHERHLFAKELADFLQQALNHKAYDNLVVVASRDLMGELRKVYPSTVKKLISHELAKDLIPQHLSHAELVDKIKDDLDLIAF